MQSHLSFERSEGYIVDGLMSKEQFAAWQSLVNKPKGTVSVPFKSLASSEVDWEEFKKEQAEAVDLEEEIVAGNAILKGKYCDDDPSSITSRHFYANPEAVALIGIDDEENRSTMNTAKYWTLRWEAGWDIEYKSRSGESRITFWRLSNHADLVAFRGVVSPQTLGNLRVAFAKAEVAVS